MELTIAPRMARSKPSTAGELDSSRFREASRHRPVLPVPDVPRETPSGSSGGMTPAPQKSGRLVGMPVRRGNLSGVSLLFSRIW